MTEEEKALSGLLYRPADKLLVAKKQQAHNLNIEYNMTKEDEAEKRAAIIDALFPDHGKNCRVQGPIYIHYGCHTHIGDNFFGNFNLTIQDDSSVTIGNNANFGPGVTIVTPLHPMIAEERRSIKDSDGNDALVCYAKPVFIGDNCWFGANVTVCPGVKIGNGCVIGAGSVVTKDIPDNTFAAGVPCRVIRTITEKDSLKYKFEIIDGYVF